MRSYVFGTLGGVPVRTEPALSRATFDAAARLEEAGCVTTVLEEAPGKRTWGRDVKRGCVRWICTHRTARRNGGAP